MNSWDYYENAFLKCLEIDYSLFFDLRSILLRFLHHFLTETSLITFISLRLTGHHSHTKTLVPIEKKKAHQSSSKDKWSLGMISQPNFSIFTSHIQTFKQKVKAKQNKYLFGRFS